MIVFTGRIFKDDNWWIADLPKVGLMTQGTSKTDIIRMVKSLIRDAADKQKMVVNVDCSPSNEIQVSSPDTKTMVRLLLERKRAVSGFTLAQVARKMGYSSRNAYARYEQGRAIPSLDKLNELLQVFSPDESLVIVA